MLTLKRLFRRLIKLNKGFERSNLTQLNDISKGERVVKSEILQFYSANRNIGNYTPVLGIHQMLDQELDVWNIHKSPVDWEFVHKNYTQVIVGGAGLLHSVFEKFWVDLDKNCKISLLTTRSPLEMSFTLVSPPKPNRFFNLLSIKLRSNLEIYW